MNQFHNPIFLLRVLKSYIFDINRVWKTDLESLKKYQNKSFRKIVNYAYTVPLYHKKYKQAGIHPNDIKGINDIKKLPFITKNDLRSNFPDGIIPREFDKKNGFLLSTSGSTGKPVFVYCDKFSAVKRLEGFVRTLRAYGGNWRKSKTVLIIDLSPGSVEYATFQASALPFLKKIISLDNIKYIDISEKPEIVAKKINEFKPEFLSSDPDLLRKLASLKINGFNLDIKPKYIFSGGSMLDQYTRKYIEDAFETKILDIYGSTEAGPMAFECLEGGYYHVHSDFVFLEFLDNENNSVDFGKSGKSVVTKLYGQDTPIIRYTGIEDTIKPIEKETNCGIITKMIKQIEGR